MLNYKKKKRLICTSQKVNFSKRIIYTSHHFFTQMNGKKRPNDNSTLAADQKMEKKTFQFHRELNVV